MSLATPVANRQRSHHDQLVSDGVFRNGFRGSERADVDLCREPPRCPGPAVKVLEMVRQRAADAEDVLPAPVATYLDRALHGSVGRIDRVDLTQTGEILLGRRWFPFQATQRFTTNPPGFVWDTRVRLFPLVYATVRDSYLNGSA